jgi:cob(I)alamin adenosyltransferase
VRRLSAAPNDGQKRFKVYTKTGDGGSTALYGGARRPKTDAVFSALGDTDELNAHLGLARIECETNSAVAPVLRL